MGACEFRQVARGETARKAFSTAVAEARCENGEEGYTGSIAEKHHFVMVHVPEGRDADGYVDEMFEADDGRIRDKWGPAGCIALGGDEFLFFGRANG